MGKSKTLALDIGVAAGLAVALLVVFLVDRISAPADDADAPKLEGFKVREFGATSPGSQGQGAQTQGSKAKARHLRLGVTDVPGQWDNMAGLLREMGKGPKDKELPPIDPITNTFKSIAGYQTTRLSNGELLSRELRKEFDVLFLACSPIDLKKDAVDIQNTASRLRQFVEDGGTLYASDWRFEYLKLAFPEFVDPAASAFGLQGKKGTVMAKVLDPGLSKALGPEVEKTSEVKMTFDLDQWKPAAFTREKVTVYMTGKYVGLDFKTRDGLLLVKFSPSKRKGAKTEPGTVIFTSFHNAKQSVVAEKLLKYLVFYALTAGVESEQRAKIVGQGFVPKVSRLEQGFESKGSSLVSSSGKDFSVTRKYKNEKRGKLLFSLAFNPQEGVKLRLRVKSPDGKVGEGVRPSPFAIEVADAQLGWWEYSVTAVEGLSDPTFPFTVTVSEAKAAK